MPTLPAASLSLGRRHGPGATLLLNELGSRKCVCPRVCSPETASVLRRTQNLLRLFLGQTTNSDCTHTRAHTYTHRHMHEHGTHLCAPTYTCTDVRTHTGPVSGSARWSAQCAMCTLIWRSLGTRDPHTCQAGPKPGGCLHSSEHPARTPGTLCVRGWLGARS